MQENYSEIIKWFNTNDADGCNDTKVEAVVEVEWSFSKLTISRRVNGCTEKESIKNEDWKMWNFIK